MKPAGPDDPHLARQRQAFNREIGQRVKAARLDCGLTQREVAMEMGIAHRTLSRIEYGLFDPDLFLLSRIAEMCQVPLVAFIPMRVRG